MAVSQKEVLEYAKEIKEHNPTINKETMRNILEAKFIQGKDYFLENTGVVGAIKNPLDWINGLMKILEGLKHIFMGKKKIEGIRKIIEGVLIILF